MDNAFVSLFPFFSFFREGERDLKFGYGRFTSRGATWEAIKRSLFPTPQQFKYFTFHKGSFVLSPPPTMT